MSEMTYSIIFNNQVLCYTDDQKFAKDFVYIECEEYSAEEIRYEKVEEQDRITSSFGRVGV